MGALHQGHISLIEKAIDENDFCVVSIYINPLQFNNKNDLNNYPRTINDDLDKINTLNHSNCYIYLPSNEDIYPEIDSFKAIDLKGFDQEMEGKYRPGHFQGVVHVVHNLFKQISPSKAYFGKKDFQQLFIIKHIANAYKFDVEIVSCETIRSHDGLALSSRNKLLNSKQQKDALILSSVLKEIKSNKQHHSPEESLIAAKKRIERSALRLEYIHLVNTETLQQISSEWANNSTCCLAAYCGDIRLIDCIEIQ